jgi:hypothetical protein
MRSGKYLPNLINLLSKVDSKKRGKNVDTQIKCGDLSLSIVLIGKKATVRRLGSEPYVNHIKRVATEGYKVIYVMAGGRRNCDVARETVTRVLKETTIKKTDEYKDIVPQKHEDMEMLCVRLENATNLYDPISDYFAQNY